VGETQQGPFQLSFNSSVPVAFRGSRVTSDGGLIVVRELDERLGLSGLMQRHLSDSRRSKNIQLPLLDLARQSVYSRQPGYEDVNDAERLAQDPAFRLIGSRKVLERGAALISRVHSFETEILSQAENLAGLARINCELIARAEALEPRRRVVLDMDSTEVAVFGEQEQSAYNGHFESTCYHPLPKAIGNWSLTSLQQRLVKTGGRFIRHAHYYWPLLAESHLTRRFLLSSKRSRGGAVGFDCA
jgi:Transposase DDE domain group 1